MIVRFAWTPTILFAALAVPGCGEKPAATPVAVDPAKRREKVDREIAAILESIAATETSASASSPEVDRLVALGHDAVPGLLEALRKYDAADQSSRAATAAYALAELVVDADAPELDKLLKEGHGPAASALRLLRLEIVAPILASAVDRDLMTVDVEMAILQVKGRPPVLVKAVNAWLERNLDTDDQYSLTGVSGILGRIGDEESARLVRKVFGVVLPDLESKWQVPVALVQLGDRDAVEPLVIIFRAQKDLRETIGLELHKAFGAAIPVEVWPMLRNGIDRSADMLDVDAFLAWWRDVREKAVFDRSKRTWSIAK